MLKKIVGLVIASLLLTMLFGSAVTAQENDPYAPYRGTTIVVSWPSLFHFQQAATLIPMFEEETGIKVEVDFLQYEAMVTAQQTQLQRERGGDYDVVAWVVFSKSEYVKNGWLTPLAEFFVNPALADPNYNPDDLVEAYLESGGIVGGELGYLSGPTQALYGIPFGAETSILATARTSSKSTGFPCRRLTMNCWKRHSSSRITCRICTA